MSDAPTVPVTVNILDKDYKIACPEDEREALEASARLVDERMREMRRHTRVAGNDRIAVITALNLAGELLARGDEQAGPDPRTRARIERLADRIDEALG